MPVHRNQFCKTFHVIEYYHNVSFFHFVRKGGGVKHISLITVGPLIKCHYQCFIDGNVIHETVTDRKSMGNKEDLCAL